VTKIISIEENIKKAKLAVIKKYEGEEKTERKWIELTADSYNEKSYRIALFVLEGSPAKGYVIANYGRKIVMAFSVDDKKIKTYTEYDDVR